MPFAGGPSWSEAKQFALFRVPWRMCIHYESLFRFQNALAVEADC